MARTLEYPTGARLVTVDTFDDERGYAEEFHFPIPIRRTLTVFSERRVIRGMHFQDWRVAPLCKIVSVVAGRVVDYVFDLRKDPPEGQRFVLGEESQFLYVPPWCAHGYAVLDAAVMRYHFDGPRNVAAERIIRWSTLPIAWPVFPEGPILSDKDRRAPSAVQVLAELARPI